MSDKVSNLEEILNRIEEAGEENEQVTIDEILDEIGHRSFAPILLLAGIIISAPIVGDIPGVPTVMGAFVFLTSVQMLLNKDHLWLPGWLLNRSVEKNKIRKGVSYMYKPARFIDRLSKPRLGDFTHGPGLYLIAAICLVISLALPAMEFIPFSANIAGIAFTIFGLALITNDGILAILALLFAFGTFGFLLYGVL